MSRSSRGPRTGANGGSCLTARGQTKQGEAKALWQAAQDQFLALHGRERSESLRAALLDIAYDARLGQTDRSPAP